MLKDVEVKERYFRGFGLVGVIVLLGIFGYCILFVNAQESGILTLKVDILTGLPTSNESKIQIEVPPELFMGNATIGELSKETNVTIRNNSTVKIRLESELINESDIIFSHLILRESSGKFMSVDNFFMNISGKTKNVYMKLNLTNFNEELEGDLIGHESDIRFIAMEA